MAVQENVEWKYIHVSPPPGRFPKNYTVPFNGKISLFLVKW